MFLIPLAPVVDAVARIGPTPVFPQMHSVCVLATGPMMGNEIPAIQAMYISQMIPHG
jgi:hypothetical protein